MNNSVHGHGFLSKFLFGPLKTAIAYLDPRPMLVFPENSKKRKFFIANHRFQECTVPMLRVIADERLTISAHGQLTGGKS
jgi:hypothetical protein